MGGPDGGADEPDGDAGASGGPAGAPERRPDPTGDDPAGPPTLVLRGRAGDPEADARTTRDLAAAVAASGRPAVRAWTPGRQVAFGPRDVHAAGYGAARAAARSHGFPPREREVGGRAVAYAASTVAFVRVAPVGDERTGVVARYDAALEALEAALSGLGVAVQRGEPPDAFCPGSHSLSAAGDGKLVGLAQRVGGGAARTGGVVVVADRRPIRAVLADVYAALGLSFDPATVGSVAAAGGPADPTRVARAVERALVGDRRSRVVPAAEWRADR